MSEARKAGADSKMMDSNVKRAPRAFTKLAAIAQALRSDEGASIAAIVAITGWKVRTIRGVLAGTLKHRHGLVITSAVVAGVRVYRAAPATSKPQR